MQSAIKHYNRAVSLSDRGNREDAIKYYKRALRLAPSFHQAHFNLGNELAATSLLSEAMASYRRAITFYPSYVDAMLNLAGLLMMSGVYGEAEKWLTEALRIRPKNTAVGTTLGVLYLDTDRLDDAAAILEAVLEHDPDYDAAYTNLGNVCQRQMRLNAAIGNYRCAIDLKPNDPDAHHNLAIALLKTGQYEEGWKEYEWRFKTRQLSGTLREFTKPQWLGEDIRGKTLLIWAEQGFGDSIQFCRYASLAALHGAKIILEVPEPLNRLMRSLPGVSEVTSTRRAEGFDYHCPMMSLPGILGTDEANLPRYSRYLESKVEGFERMDNQGDIRVGIVLSGNPRPHDTGLQATDKRRSMTLDAVLPLLHIPGFEFYNLQYGAIIPEGVPLIDFMPEMRDFADTAALIEDLDLVITVDTAVAHLAAALGCPTWVLNRFDGCWRWLADRTDSPWYPSVRLFNQKTAGNWGTVIEEVRDALLSLPSLAQRLD